MLVLFQLVKLWRSCSLGSAFSCLSIFTSPTLERPTANAGVLVESWRDGRPLSPHGVVGGGQKGLGMALDLPMICHATQVGRGSI